MHDAAVVSAGRQRGRWSISLWAGTTTTACSSSSCQLISRFRRFHTWHAWGGESRFKPSLFDYSGTLFRLEEDDSWFHGMDVDERQIDGHVQAELMRRMTAPTGQQSR